MSELTWLYYLKADIATDERLLLERMGLPALADDDDELDDRLVDPAP